MAIRIIKYKTCFKNTKTYKSIGNYTFIKIMLIYEAIWVTYNEK